MRPQHPIAMTPRQQTALRNPCRLAAETANSAFAWDQRRKRIRFTVNTGYECIEGGFGGSVWHASVSFRTLKPEAIMRRALARVLHGVGIEHLQWFEEDRSGTWHCRRRLTPGEEALAGAPVDIRGTPEHVERARIVAARHDVSLDTVLKWG